MEREKQREAGQIIIETLLLLMVLLAVVFTYVEVCLIAIDKHEVDRIARYAARVWSVRPWEAQKALTSAAELRAATATGAFYKLQTQIGKVRETSRTTDGTERSGLEFRTYIPLIMPFTEEFAGWQINPQNAELNNPDWAPITPEEINTLQSYGVRNVVRSETFIPIDREPDEKPSLYDNDYNDNEDL